MAVSSIGNLTFINQNAQVGANTQANTQHRGDIANLANMQNFQNKLDQIQEVRKLEENEMINPDAQSKNQNSQEERRAQRGSAEESEQENPKRSEHLLDIRA